MSYASCWSVRISLASTLSARVSPGCSSAAGTSSAVERRRPRRGIAGPISRRPSRRLFAPRRSGRARPRLPATRSGPRRRRPVGVDGTDDRIVFLDDVHYLSPFFISGCSYAFGASSLRAGADRRRKVRRLAPELRRLARRQDRPRGDRKQDRCDARKALGAHRDGVDRRDKIRARPLQRGDRRLRLFSGRLDRVEDLVRPVDGGQVLTFEERRAPAPTRAASPGSQKASRARARFGDRRVGVGSPSSLTGGSLRASAGRDRDARGRRRGVDDLTPYACASAHTSAPVNQAPRARRIT